MPANIPGILAVILITIVAGGIAYIGDRVGHQVGRKRLTLFGLRPKYTSTIVAVATGMLIALSVTLIALIGSSQVRTAFFRLGQLNAQINQLQAQALEESQELATTRNQNIVLSKGTPIGPATVIDMSLPEPAQLKAFRQAFDETVRYTDTYAPRLGLHPSRSRATDPAVQSDMLRVLRDARLHFSSLGDRDGPVLFLPIAATNIFIGDTVTFSYASWADRKLYSDGELVASVDVDGGHPIADPDLALLSSRATRALASRGMPAPFFTTPGSGFDPGRLRSASAVLARVRGRFELTARSEGDLYPHTGGFILSVGVEPRR